MVFPGFTDKLYLNKGLYWSITDRLQSTRYCSYAKLFRARSGYNTRFTGAINVMYRVLLMRQNSWKSRRHCARGKRIGRCVTTLQGR